MKINDIQNDIQFEIVNIKTEGCLEGQSIIDYKMVGSDSIWRIEIPNSHLRLPKKEIKKLIRTHWSGIQRQRLEQKIKKGDVL